MVKLLLWVAALLQVSIGLRRAKENSIQANLDVASYMPICDDSLVSKACVAFTEEAGRRSVAAKDLADSLVVTQASIGDFLLELGLDEHEASCKDLCLRTAASFPQKRMPPASNVGCHMSGSEKVCDFDLSSQGLAAVAQTANPHRFHPANTSDDGPRQIVPAAPKVPVKKPHAASFTHVQVRVAHWF